MCGPLYSKGGEQMANLTRAYGTLTLAGNWAQEDIALLNPVVKSWALHDYGLSADGPFSVERREVSFFGDGAWDFYGVLENLPEWTEDWIEHPKPGTEQPLNRETYEALIRVMAEKELSISVVFTEECEGMSQEEREEEHRGAFHGEVEIDGEERFYSLWYEDLDDEDDDDCDGEEDEEDE